MCDREYQSFLFSSSSGKMHYKAVKPEEIDRSKHLALFLHGASPSSQHTEFWDSILETMNKYCNSIRLDALGHGKSDLSGDHSSDQRLQTTLEFIEFILPRFSFKTLIIVGRSLGGLISIKLAQLASNFISGLGLIAPAGSSQVSEALENWIKPMMVLWDTEDPVVSFNGYKNIKSSVTQTKLFAIGENIPEAHILIPRSPDRPPSHAPELVYPELFEVFLAQLVADVSN